MRGAQLKRLATEKGARANKHAACHTRTHARQVWHVLSANNKHIYEEIRFKDEAGGASSGAAALGAAAAAAAVAARSPVEDGSSSSGADSDSMGGGECEGEECEVEW